MIKYQHKITKVWCKVSTVIFFVGAAENNERQTDLTTSISTTKSPVGGGDEGILFVSWSLSTCYSK